MTLRPLVWGTLVAGTGLILSGIVWGTWLRAGNGVPSADDVLAPGPVLANELPRLLPTTPSVEGAPLAAIPGAESAPDKAGLPETERDHEVRATINRLLPQASADEREIWFQQFRELPPGVVEDLLKLRRDTHGGGKPLWSDTSLMSPTILNGTRAAPLATTPSHSGTTASLKALHDLQRIAVQNLLHSQTEGYCRLTPQLVPGSESASDPERTVLGLFVAGTLLDTQPGPMLATGRSLDVAIESAADCPLFLQVATSHGPGFTRRGRLELDGERQLGVRFASEFCPLEPRLQLAAHLAYFEISAAGEVSAKGAPQDPWEPVGRLKLVQFSHPERLQYASGGWLEATAASGPAQPAPEQGWAFKPRTLEGSNADPAGEQRQLEWVQQRREMLQTLEN